MNIQPIANNVLIKPIVEELKNGLIHVASSSHLSHLGKEPLKGIVVACGPGTYNKKGVRVPLDFKPGDKVLYMNHDIYNKFDYNGEEVIMMKSNYIVVVLEDGQ